MISDGPFIKNDEDGRLYEKGTYKNGKLDGLCEMYYPNGQVRHRWPYKDGKLNGLYEGYFENGHLSVRCVYKDGKLDGAYEEYYLNGRIRSVCPYQMGKENGPCEKYTNDGQFDQLVIYKYGRIITTKKELLTLKDVLPNWRKQHPNPTTEDFLSHMYGTGENVITCLVRAGFDVLEKAFPVKTWATMEAVPDLKKIFSSVPREAELMEPMKELDHKLRLAYNQNQERAEKRRQSGFRKFLAKLLHKSDDLPLPQSENQNSDIN